MRKVIGILLLIIILGTPLFATPPVEYQVEEFPIWAITLRRGETLFFGSLPLTFALTSLTYSIAQNAGAPALSSTELGETAILFGSAAVLSATIALIDYYIGK
jgi:hypothetical protein